MRLAALQRLLEVAQQIEEQESGWVDDSDVDAEEDLESEEHWYDAEDSEGVHEEGEQGCEEYDHPSQIPRFQDTSSWYKRNFSRGLYPNARITLLKAVFMLMSWKADHNVTDAAFGALLGMLTELFLPEVSW